MVTANIVTGGSKRSTRDGLVKPEDLLGTEASLLDIPKNTDADAPDGDFQGDVVTGNIPMTGLLSEIARTEGPSDPNQLAADRSIEDLSIQRTQEEGAIGSPLTRLETPSESYNLQVPNLSNYRSPEIGDSSNGIVQRAQNMGNAFANGDLLLGLDGSGQFINEPSIYQEAKSGALVGPELSNRIVASGVTGNVVSAFSRMNGITDAVDGKKTITPEVAQIMSLVVETELGNIFSGELEAEIDPIELKVEDNKSVTEYINQGKVDSITAAKNNEKIGRQIFLDKQRLDREISEQSSEGLGIEERQAMMVPTTKDLPRQEAAMIGAVAKETWAKLNPNLIVKQKDNQTGQTIYILTPEGENAMADSKYARSRISSTPDLQPRTTPKVIDTDLIANTKKAISGNKRGMELGATILEAKGNLEQIAHFVKKRALKISYMLLLPTLNSRSENTWQSEAVGAGPSKLIQYKSAKSLQDQRFKEDPSLTRIEVAYNPEQQMEQARNKLAQEIVALAKARKQANYLDWSVQGFQGRLTPMQTHFNPTSSKLVRHLTGGLPIQIKEGSRTEKNLIQIYAMTLLPKGSFISAEGQNLAYESGEKYLPNHRARLLQAKSTKLYELAKAVRSAMTMTDAQSEAISVALENRVALDSPQFPNVPSFNLDPSIPIQAELLSEISKKDQTEALIYLENLLDYGNYYEFKKGMSGNTQFFSAANVYLDGKTHGLASNAMIMGIVEAAYLTGVMRKNNDGKFALEEGDIRTRLSSIAKGMIQDNFHDLNKEQNEAMKVIANAVFNDRDLAKFTTMTFGYGKEIESFVTDIKKSISEIKTTELENINKKNTNPPAKSEFVEALNNIKGLTNQDISALLLSKYGNAILQVMSDEAVESRQIMRGVSALHAASDSIFSMKSAVGMTLIMAGEVSTGSEGGTSSTFNLRTREELEAKTSSPMGVISYDTRQTSAAPKTYSQIQKNEFGDSVRVSTSVPGAAAITSSVVAPVQSVDAATMALSLSGRSWDRISKKSPHTHTVYDAIKTDAANFEDILVEVNKNWEKVTLEWSYLSETLDALKRRKRQLNRKFTKFEKSQPLDLSESAFMDYIMVDVDKRYGKLLDQSLPTSERKRSKSKYLNEMYFAMSESGYKEEGSGTIGNLIAFNKMIEKHLNLDSRLTKLIGITSKNKLKIKKMLKESGYSTRTEGGENITLQFYD